MTDALVFPYAERLLDCLCDALATSIGGAVCSCCVRHGGHLVAMDSCACQCTGAASGQASVQITNLYPSSKFPRNSIDEWDDACNTVTWVAELTMTVYRCVSVLAENGTPPTCAQLEADARKIASDRDAMMRALICCDWRRPQPGWDERRIIPGSWTPVAPQGGCAGGFMTVLVDVGPFCCPEPEPAP